MKKISGKKGSTTARDRLIKEEDRQFISQVYSDYEASKEMKPIDQWQKYDEYLEDDQWDAADSKDEWKPQPQVNICWKTLRSIHANITSGKTAINVTCRRPLYDDVTQKVADMLEYYWNALDMDAQLSEAEWIRPKIGTVVFKAPWNPSKNDGKGDIDTYVVHPANCFPDPNITNPRHIQSAEFIDFATPKSVKYILNHYSKEKDPLCKYKRDDLKELLIPESAFDDTEIYGDAVVTASGQVPTDVIGKDKSYRSLNHRGRVQLHEYWYKDDNGKLQVAWLAGQTLLKNTADDDEMSEEGFYKHGRYPVVIIPYVMKDKRLWGRGEFQSLVGINKRDGIQDIVNKMMQTYLVNLCLYGQGQTFVRWGSVKNISTLTTEAGMVVPTKGNPHSDIRREYGQTMPRMMNDIEAVLSHADRITNLWDVTQGRSTPYTKTAGGTMALLEQAMKPQNDVATTFNQGMKELLEIWMEHAAEFITTDREYTIDRGQGQKVFDFNPSEILGAPKRIMDESGMVVDDEDGETRRLYFNINVDVGAGMSITKAYLQELAVMLYQNKALDIEGLYRMLPEWPGKQETLDRMVKQPPMQPGMEGQGPPQGGQPLAEGQPPEGGQEADGQKMAVLFQQLPEEVQAYILSLGEQEAMKILQEMVNLPPEQLEGYIDDLMVEAQMGQPRAQPQPQIPM